MGGDFELLEHPSDIGVLARGDSRERALIEASKAVTSIMVNPAGIRRIEERSFQVGGSDAASQIVNWLNEIFFLFDAEGLIFADFAIDSWTPAGIRGRARGENVDQERHEIRTAVKAATYHQFDMRTTGPGGWELRVFLDV